jgi:hypothetical protein
LTEPDQEGTEASEPRRGNASGGWPDCEGEKPNKAGKPGSEEDHD